MGPFGPLGRSLWTAGAAGLRPAPCAPHAALLARRPCPGGVPPPAWQAPCADFLPTTPCWVLD
eukprot:6733341-Pyramimonas_sp.AAC.1